MSKEDNHIYSLNLASRPFINMTVPVTVATAVFAALALFTIINVLVLISAETDSLGFRQQVDDALQRTDALRQKINAVDQDLKDFRIAGLRGELEYANALIKRRSLSWTRLFDRLEKLAPGEVRMIRISPVVREGLMQMSWRVEVPNQDAIRTFIDDLEKSPHFKEIRLISEIPSPDGGMYWELNLDYLDEE